MNKERIADGLAVGSWGIFGLSMTQINEVLQGIALLLTIIATLISIAVNYRKWTKP